MTWAVMWQHYGWVIVQIEDGTALPVCSVGNDRDLAVQIRDWLTHQQRIAQLLDRHGYVDVPLDQVQTDAG